VLRTVTATGVQRLSEALAIALGSIS
jgi:hypothetical protein